MANRYEAQDSAFVVTFVINSVITIIFFFLFCFLRRKYKSFYQYRYEKNHKGIVAPPSDGFFSWVGDTLRYDLNRIKDSAGMDGYMYLRNVKTNFLIMLVIMVLGAVMLYPTNAVGKYNDHREKDEDGNYPDPVVGLSRISMGNIERGSSLLWVHLVFVLFVTFTVLFFTYRDYRDYSKNRIVYRQQSRLSNYSILLRDIPIQMFTKDELSHYFRNHLANQSDLLDISLQYPAPHIYKLVNQRETFIKKYEAAIEKYRKTQEKPQVKLGLCGCFGEKVDAIDHYQTQIDDLTKKIEDERAAAESDYYEKNAGKKVAGTGFVVFNQRQIQKEMVQTIMHEKYQSQFSRYYAPDPNDVFWPNIHIGLKQYYIRLLLVSVFTFFLIFFWMIPVAFLSGFSNLGTLAKVPAFSWLVDIIEKSDVLTGFLQGFLPNLILIIFMALLIPIMYAISRATGYFANSKIEASVFSKYFLFLVFNVFLVSAIAGTVFQSIKEIADNPGSIISTIANALGGLSFQMINYVLLAASGLMGGLARVVGLIIRNIKLRWLAKTRRQIDEITHQGPFSYGVAYATNLLILQLCLAYCTLSPFIVIFGVWYFGVTYLVCKYNIIWVNTPNYQSGGMFYPMSFRRTLVGLLIYHILMIGTFNVYKFYYGILVVIPLVVTIIFWYVCERIFCNISKNGILDPYQKHMQQLQAQEIEMEQSISSSSQAAEPIQPHMQETFNDGSHSIFEYNQNMYKPPYYPGKLMEPNVSFGSEFPLGSASV
ncbi:hypothetical protein DICPUDRAFT_88828 [Dictyostelium purpureum]|uniref:CSC1/OSCA1-like 7TM region domain-containing protein n=1 Tax=Dictyostelium purpureum TaxID=5786 RepID=F0ZRV8_DICPU|nr:uncharacterized protein DICPUDRAFT_88828 [Dictyostelium purpureum]EGC33329.1 hypothetical protein DICPUDRAFT_88828 [Dictyostelium purpureum]|eukprot:XP_003290145.1 hypothetical protein DICPUDRAFT_88828 [Dictyostelium purpureum]